MATTSELPNLDSAMSTLKEKKNFLIGAAAVLLLVIAVVLFIRTQVAEARYGPWRVAIGSSFPWEASPEELAARAEEVAGSEAEPLLLYWEALRLHDEKRTEEALDKLKEFGERFPDHYLASRTMIVPETPTGELMTPSDRLGYEIVKMAEWGNRYPSPTANPAPAADHKVTLQTDRGPLELSLHVTESPETCASFVQLAANLKGTFVLNAIEDSWIELGLKDTGDSVEVTTGLDRFPLLEDNSLYHFKGSVAFAQRALSEAPHNPSLKIWLEDNHMEDGSSTVFASVTAGIDLLSDLAKETKAEDNFTRLAEPVAITDVEVQSTLPTEPPAAPETDAGDEETDPAGDGS